jgi:lipoprotein-anchoring transpeptidase ErfK/SrfK
MAIGIGGPSSPTPVGRFGVTDKLIPGRGVSYYGCCLLALSGRQPHLRPGWAGGDRIAIHGGSTGSATSAGCLHASDADLKALMKLIPIGTPVYIRP